MLNPVGRTGDAPVQSRGGLARMRRALNARAGGRHKLGDARRAWRFGMQQEKIIRAMFMGHEIIARNFWSATREAFSAEATLAFNGMVVDRTTELSPRKARLGATLIDGVNSHAVEVIFGGWFIVRMKILIDGRKVAGNLR
jgi:hypothetical protein